MKLQNFVHVSYRNTRTANEMFVSSIDSYRLEKFYLLRCDNACVGVSLKKNLSLLTGSNEKLRQEQGFQTADLQINNAIYNNVTWC